MASKLKCRNVVVADIMGKYTHTRTRCILEQVRFHFFILTCIFSFRLVVSSHKCVVFNIDIFFFFHFFSSFSKLLLFGIIFRHFHIALLIQFVSSFELNVSRPPSLYLLMVQQSDFILILKKIQFSFCSYFSCFLLYKPFISIRLNT